MVSRKDLMLLFRFLVFPISSTPQNLKQDDTSMHFSIDDPGKNLHGVKKRSHAAIPILGSISSTPQNLRVTIFSPACNVISDSVLPESLNAMIKYSKQVLMIFVPLRSQEVLEDRVVPCNCIFTESCQILPI